MATGVYWTGADGNTYMKADTLSGVVKWSAPLLSPTQMGLTQIPDPLGASTPTVAPSNANVSAAPAKVVNQAAVGATQSAIDSLGTEQAQGNTNIDDSLNSVNAGYDVNTAQAEGDYGQNVVTNNQNLDKNTQNAYVSAAQGRRGLRGTLASIGALSGDGGVLADEAVTTEANRDIGGAIDTANTNSTALDKAIGTFRQEDKQRRADAQTTATNQRTALEGGIASKRQSFYQKMAELYASGGNDAAANDYLGRAGGLNNEIASKTAVQAAPQIAKAAAFTPGTLASYLAGGNDMTVKVGAGGLGQPATILAGADPNQKRKDRAEAVATPAV